MMQILLRRWASTAAVVATSTLVLALGSGCQAPGRNAKVPADAQTLGSAQSEAFTWTADRTGTVYVVDVAEDQLRYSGPLRTGQTLVVDPAAKRITIADRVVSEGKLHSGHRHEVLLKSGAVRTDRR